MEARALDSYTEDDYYNISEDTRAELIEGQFYFMAAPSRRHQRISSELYTLINTYVKSGKGKCQAYYAPFAVKLFDDKKTIVEPDISVICDPDKLTDNGCSGAPDWIIEIVSPANPGHDYVKKLNLYMDAGVREYWIIDPQKKIILVYFFEDSIDVRLYTFNDTIKVNIYENLSIDFSSLDI